MLLANGANMEIKNQLRETPLHSAAYKNSIDAARLLLDNGAEVNVVDSDKKTPQQVARKNGNNELADIIAAASDAG